MPNVFSQEFNAPDLSSYIASRRLNSSSWSLFRRNITRSSAKPSALMIAGCSSSPPSPGMCTPVSGEG